MSASRVAEIRFRLNKAQDQTLFATIRTVAFQGIQTRSVDVQIQVTNGLPSFSIVGLADKAVSESKERVRAALQSLGIALPPKRITVNLSPADLAKAGSHYDLPIAVALLASIGVIPPEHCARTYALGELGLDASIRAVTGVLPSAITAASAGYSLICPIENANEALWGINKEELKPAGSLLQLVNHLLDAVPLTFPARATIRQTRPSKDRVVPDLSSVRGQAVAKRALEIAAAGAHNLLMVGPPGAGKSLLASTVPGLLPELSAAERLEVSMIHSVAGEQLPNGLVEQRPFRSPHHSASQVAMVGGGHNVRPGEVTLAHRGVLFLDELPEFPRGALESMRQPIESGDVTVARANAHVTFPANFQLIAAMNPCRCGYLSDPARACSKAPRCAEDYTNKISGPMLDRFDLVVDVQETSALDLLGTAPPDNNSSEDVRNRVMAARVHQRRRFEALNEPGDSCNSDLTATNIESACELSSDAQHILLEAAGRMQLSGRGLHRVLKVSRTIADLANSHAIQRAHITEALSFRRHRFT